MRVKNVFKKDLVRALQITNRRWFEGNLTFASLGDGKFTLGVHDSNGPGGRLGTKKKDGTRRIVPFKACWHAHGRFFEVLFALRPGAVVESKVHKITGPTMADGNWHDHPIIGETDIWYSDLCECKRGLLIPHHRRRVLIKMPRRSEAMRPEGLLRKVQS